MRFIQSSLLVSYFDISSSTQVTFAMSGLPAWWQIRDMTWIKYQKVIWYSSSTWLTSSASSRHEGFLRVEWRVDQHSDEMFINTTHPSMSWIWMKNNWLFQRTFPLKTENVFSERQALWDWSKIYFRKDCLLYRFVVLHSQCLPQVFKRITMIYNVERISYIISHGQQSSFILSHNYLEQPFYLIFITILLLSPVDSPTVSNWQNNPAGFG